MARRIRAHFDGRVFIPDEPVDLPPNSAVEVELGDSAGKANGAVEPEVIRRRLDALHRFAGAVSAPAIPAEALRRERLYE